MLWQILISTLTARIVARRISAKTLVWRVKTTKKSSDTSSTESKITELDSKWSEALILSKTLQPAFSSEVKVTSPHSPPSNITRDSEPFFQPTGCTGKAFSADMHQVASQP